MKKNGFTLIEIMLALLIFAIMATIAATGLSIVLQSRTRANANSARLQSMQLAIVIISNDIEQMVNRPIAGNRGDRIQAVIGKSNYIEFTHAGYVNPLMSLQRSTLQRVAYELKKNELIRITWPALDRAPDTKPLSRVLLKNVISLQFRYLNKKNKFYDSWPPPQGQEYFSQSPLPQAIELTLSISKWGDMQRLFMVYK